MLVPSDGTAKFTDFGLARLTDASAEEDGFTKAGLALGTPDYMAPEQKRGLAVDHHADIFAVGVMLYEILCRETPQGAREAPSHRAGSDPKFDLIVLRAMRRDPAMRFQSTTALGTEVESVLTPPSAARSGAR